MRKILIVVDMQNDFIDGALGTPEAVAIVDAVKAKIGSYDPKDVVFTRDTHEKDYLDTQEGKYLPVVHCIRNTDGWQIRPELLEGIDDPKIFDKPTFGSRPLAEYVSDMYDKAKGELEVEIIGLCTDICVVSNALMLKAFRPEMKITLDPACCAGVTPEKHQAAIETMQSCQIQITE